MKKIIATRSLHFLVSLTLILSSLTTSAAGKEVLFEGYSKVMSQGAPAGYVISRYEYDPKLKRFFSSYYLKTNSNLSESLKAIADSEFNPISYEYTSIVGKDTKTIDAKFAKNKMSAVINTNGKATRVEKKFEQGVFLSTFLFYVMLKSPSGLKSDSKYNFKAFSEEDAEITSGSAAILKLEKFKGLDVYRVNNVFKGLEYTSFLNERGEILGTESKSQGISTEVVALPIEATQGMSFVPGTVKAIFGDIPAGTTNEVSKNTKAYKPEAGDKQEGVPQGTGMQLKTEPAPANKGQ